ncbi:hypothetical protein MOSE0_K07316 [Monosporozyma servazzii]
MRHCASGPVRASVGGTKTMPCRRGRKKASFAFFCARGPLQLSLCAFAGAAPAIVPPSTQARLLSLPSPPSQSPPPPPLTLLLLSPRNF